MSTYFIQFNCDRNIKHQADIGEQIGNFCNGLLAIGFGREVVVSKGITSGSFEMEEKKYSILERIGVVALSILLFPVAGLLAAIGCIGFSCSKTREKFVDCYTLFKHSVSELSKLDLSKEKNIDALCKEVPGYDLNMNIKLRNSIDIDGTVEKWGLDLKSALQGDDIDTKALMRTKTMYLKFRDIQKGSKLQDKTFPESSLEIPLMKKDDFLDVLKQILPCNVDQWDIEPSAKPFLIFPDSLYSYSHPKDTDEGLNPMVQFFGTVEKDKNWESALNYAEEKVLPHPIKNMDSLGLFQLLSSLHSRIIGKKDPIRDKFSLVIDPCKTNMSFPSFKAYLKKQEEGDVLVKRINRLEEKFMRWGTFEKAAPYIPVKHWEALQKAVFLPPSPFGLEKKAKDFLEKASLLMKEESYHPFQVAAYLHYGLTSLHLFEDANGRLARLVANIYLMQHGYQPFFVVVDSIYTNLFQNDQYDVGFGKYLLSNWNMMKKIEEQGTIGEGPQCAMQ